MELYMLTIDGQDVLAHPLPLKELIALYGSIQKLEANGFIVKQVITNRNLKYDNKIK